jgi:hypothetical protein
MWIAGGHSPVGVRMMTMPAASLTPVCVAVWLAACRGDRTYRPGARIAAEDEPAGVPGILPLHTDGRAAPGDGEAPRAHGGLRRLRRGDAQGKSVWARVCVCARARACFGRIWVLSQRARARACDAALCPPRVTGDKSARAWAELERAYRVTLRPRHWLGVGWAGLSTRAGTGRGDGAIARRDGGVGAAGFAAA